MHLRASIALLSLVTWLALPTLAQIQEQKVFASDAMDSARFGSAAATDGLTAVLGAVNDHPLGAMTGAAYVFARQGSAWRETQKLVPVPAIGSQHFGSAVALAGDWLAVGASGDNGFAGAVYVYRRQGGSFVQHQKLTAAYPESPAQFGASLALTSDRMSVGAPHASTHMLSSGAAYVFELQGSTWVQAAKLAAVDAAYADGFGASVAILGDVVLVGSRLGDGPPSDSGAAYVFERGAGGWSQTQKLVPLQSQSEDGIGSQVAMLSDSLFVAAPKRDEAFADQGAVFVYQRAGGLWVESQRLLASDPAQGLHLATSMVVDGDRLLCGAPSDGDQGFASGSAYLFERKGGSWVQSGKLLAGDGNATDFFASAVALSGEWTLLGATRDDVACAPTSPNCDSGSAYFFRVGSDSMQSCSCPSPAGPCGNDDDHGGCLNSTGQGAVLSAAGSGSVALDDLRLHGQWLPPSQPALLFVGGTTAFNPLGDGRLCVQGGATGVHRFAVAFASGQGDLQYGPGLVALSQGFPALGPIQPGEDRHFQVWYRDAAGPCGTSTNLSNSLRVTFKP